MLTELSAGPVSVDGAGFIVRPGDRVTHTDYGWTGTITDIIGGGAVEASWDDGWRGSVHASVVQIDPTEPYADSIA
jgi:hypothetical protein